MGEESRFQEHLQRLNEHQKRLKLFSRDEPNWALANAWYAELDEFTIRLALIHAYAASPDAVEVQLYDEYAAWRERMDAYWTNNLLPEENWAAFYDGFATTSQGHLPDAIAWLSIAHRIDIVETNEWNNFGQAFVDIWTQAKNVEDTFENTITGLNDFFEDAGNTATKAGDFIDNVGTQAGELHSELKQAVENANEATKDVGGLSRILLVGGIATAGYWIVKKVGDWT